MSWMPRTADWLCSDCGAHVPAGVDHTCADGSLPAIVETGPEASIESGDLRAQSSYPITYYMALPIRLAREEDGRPVVSMHCTMRHHSDCTGFTQFQGKLCACDCDWCDHQEAT